MSKQAQEAEQQIQPDTAPGERLQIAREAMGLSREDVAKKLRINTAKIVAIENGDVDSIAAPVFAAGYVRAYARLVTLPADELISEFGLLPEASASEHLARTVVSGIGSVKAPRARAYTGSGFRFGGIWLLSAVVMALVVAGWLTLSHEQGAGQGTTSQSVIATPLPLHAADDNAPALPADTSSPEAAPVGGESSSDSAENGAAGQPAEPPATLVLSFEKDSWVEVSDASGKRLAYQLGRAGKVLQLEGVAPFSVKLGYLPGVAMQFNDSPIDLAPFQGKRQAEFLINENGAIAESN